MGLDFPFNWFKTFFFKKKKETKRKSPSKGSHLQSLFCIFFLSCHHTSPLLACLAARAAAAQSAPLSFQEARRGRRLGGMRCPGERAATRPISANFLTGDDDPPPNPANDLPFGWLRRARPSHTVCTARRLMSENRQEVKVNTEDVSL